MAEAEVPAVAEAVAEGAGRATGAAVAVAGATRGRPMAGGGAARGAIDATGGAGRPGTAEADVEEAMLWLDPPLASTGVLALAKEKRFVCRRLSRGSQCSRPK